MEYKGYKVESLGTYSLVQIKPKGSGSIPDILKGLYTSTTEAFKAIDLYYNSLKRGKGNGKTEESGTV